MIKFKKELKTKIILFIVAIVFILNSTVYGIDLPNKPHLRAPLQFNHLAKEAIEVLRDAPDRPSVATAATTVSRGTNDRFLTFIDSGKPHFPVAGRVSDELKQVVRENPSRIRVVFMVDFGKGAELFNMKQELEKSNEPYLIVGVEESGIYFRDAANRLSDTPNIVIFNANVRNFQKEAAKSGFSFSEIWMVCPIIPYSYYYKECAHVLANLLSPGGKLTIFTDEDFIRPGLGVARFKLFLEELSSSGLTSDAPYGIEVVLADYRHLLRGTMIYFFEVNVSQNRIRIIQYIHPNQTPTVHRQPRVSI